jgi:lysophospholipase L1-like esterase
VLELNPDITYFGVGYGTNDSWGNRRLEQSSFEGDLTTMVERLLAEGKIPVLARIPYASKEHSTLPEFNEVIDRLTRDHGLPCGPDLYAYFKGHEEELNSDGVHPTGYGYQNMNGEWAEAALELYPEAP